MIVFTNLCFYCAVMFAYSHCVSL